MQNKSFSVLLDLAYSELLCEGLHHFVRLFLVALATRLLFSPKDQTWLIRAADICLSHTDCCKDDLQ